MKSQVLVFKIDNKQYAVELFRVKKIIEMPTVTQIPKSSEHVKGLINFQNKVVTVFDLRKIKKTKKSMYECIIILYAEVENENKFIGIIADRVLDIHNDNEIKTQKNNYKCENYVKKVGTLNNKKISVLDMDKIIA